MTQGGITPIAERDGVILRPATDEDLPRLDEIVVTCYTPIHDSYVSILGQDVYQGLRRNPDQDWRVEKIARVRKTYQEHPGCFWVVEDAGTVFGFVSFAYFPEQSRVWIEENGVIPARRGQGWATFMLRHVLAHARRLGMRFASVEVDLDDVHLPARRAYQAVGFDRRHHIAIYHQDLNRYNPGSQLDEKRDVTA